MGCRCGSDMALLWLWRRPEATAPVGPLAWEPPYAASVVLKNRGKKKKKKKRVVQIKRKAVRYKPFPNFIVLSK